MSYQIEFGTAHGRGFSGSDTNGFLAKFYAWVTKSTVTGGPAWFIIDDQSALGTDPYIVVCDIAAPVVNDLTTGQNGGPPKFAKVGLVTTEAGFIRVQFYLWWDALSHVGQGVFAGYRIATYDDADFAYDFRGGSECLIIQSRLGTTWYTAILDEFTGDSNLLESKTKFGISQANNTHGSDATIQLDTSQASNFTVNKYYYIYDMSSSHTWVDYAKCLSVDTTNDLIVLDDIGRDFSSGSVIAAYPHRVYAASNGNIAAYTADMNSTFNANWSVLPYYSSLDSTYVMHNPGATIYGALQPDVAIRYISAMAPNDDGVYAVMKPGIAEYQRPQDGAATSMNRAYGVANNMYVTAKGTMSPGLDGRVIDGTNWLYFQSTYSLFANPPIDAATLFRDSTSV